MKVKSIRYGDVLVDVAKDYHIFDGGYGSCKHELLLAVHSLWMESYLQDRDQLPKVWTSPDGKTVKSKITRFVSSGKVIEITYEVGAELRTGKIYEDSTFDAVAGLAAVTEMNFEKKMLSNCILYYDLASIPVGGFVYNEDFSRPNKDVLRAVYPMICDGHVGRIRDSIIIIPDLDLYLTKKETEEVMTHLLLLHKAKGNQLLVGSCDEKLKDIGEAHMFRCPGHKDVVQTVVKAVAASFGAEGSSS